MGNWRLIEGMKEDGAPKGWNRLGGSLLGGYGPSELAFPLDHGQDVRSPSKTSVSSMIWAGFTATIPSPSCSHDFKAVFFLSMTDA